MAPVSTGVYRPVSRERRAVSATLRGFVDTHRKAAVLLGTRLSVLPRFGRRVDPCCTYFSCRASWLVAQLWL